MVIYIETTTHNLHCVKSVRIRSYSDPQFPIFGLNTERYFSECGKIRTRITPNMDTFYAVLLNCSNYSDERRALLNNLQNIGASVEAYLKPSRPPTKELFCEIVNGLKPLTIFDTDWVLKMPLSVLDNNDSQISEVLLFGVLPFNDAKNTNILNSIIWYIIYTRRCFTSLLLINDKFWKLHRFEYNVFFLLTSLTMAHKESV